ncbi:MAG: hypothetical protein JRJ12_02710 [Deltaproteobacteria bacterium]|nr:hypothetical protein [Deltaproteobacteria bacterium]MBW2071505.1 hypothetical protein [Deltaproteobacteria bacterium]
MTLSIETLAYLMAGIALGALYIKREKGLARLDFEMLPEIDKVSFEELKLLLKKSYQRTLYLSVSFLYLAFVTSFKRSPQAKTFGIILTIGLFLYNIPPRNRVMRMLTDLGIDRKVLEKRGVKL